MERKRFEAQIQASVWLEIINKATEPKAADFSKLEELGIKVEWR